MFELDCLISKIKELPISEVPLENIRTAKEFIKEGMLCLDEVEAKEIILSTIKEHFSFTEEVIKDMLKAYKNMLKQSKKEEVMTEKTVDFEEYQKSILEEIESQDTNFIVNPAQDFLEETMVYTFFKGFVPFIITSKKKVVKFDDTEDYNISLRHKDVSIGYLRPETVISYVKNQMAVNPKDIYQRIKSHLEKYIIFQDKKLYTFMSLWIIGTYFHRVFRYFPYIWINADKGSGKTRVMEVVSPLAFNGLMVANQTQATISRSVDGNSCSLFIDEFEKLPKDAQQGILTILNSGFNIDSGKTTRMESTEGGYKLKTLCTYSPKAFAGIAEISDVLQDRCIKVRMIKKRKEDASQSYKLDSRTKEYIASLRDDLYILGLDYAKEISSIYNNSNIQFPNELSDRECDIWEVVFTIASLIDGYESTTIQQEMKVFAVQSSKERSADNVEKNFSYKLISALTDILPDMKPIKEENSIKYYDSDVLFERLTQLEGFEWITHKRYISEQLKNRLHINSQRITVLGKKVIAYMISDSQLQDLVERYNLTNIIDLPPTAS